ncbi:deoxyribonuclease gamma-like [Crotalus adamanteus]|uniref:Deoxyribonuclease gamma-like n=1 Tax=Crotalus adamanteus TaxID=8729 RepID=A0AAW1BZK6_CROAD
MLCQLWLNVKLEMRMPEILLGDPLLYVSIPHTQNVMVLGDLNAGGAYIPMNAWARIRLRNHPAFYWLISDQEDTTVSHRTCCSYDRIIVHGEELLSAVVPGSAKAYNFTKELGLCEEEALEISDHYPVEVKLKLAPKTQQEL